MNGFASYEPTSGAPGNRVQVGGIPGSGTEGIIINLALNSAARANLSNITTAAQSVIVTIDYKYEGTGLATDVPADAQDRISFGVNNNAYPAPAGGLTQSQVDARVRALRTLVATIATPASGDRIFFTDENQAGDPLRYTQVSTLATAMGVPTAAVVARIPKAPMVLQAAADGGNTAGVTTITLPANYATYRTVEIAAWHNSNRQQENRIVDSYFRTAMLAAQTANRTIVLAGTPGAQNNSNLISATWNPTTRTISLNQSDRIIFASLHD